MAASHARQHLSFFLRTLGQVSCSAMSPDDSCWYGKPAPIVVGIEFERSRQQSKGWCCACVHWCQAALQPPGLVQNIQQWWEMAEDKSPYRVWRWEWGMQGSGRSVIPGDECLSHAAAPPAPFPLASSALCEKQDLDPLPANATERPYLALQLPRMPALSRSI